MINETFKSSDLALVSYLSTIFTIHSTTKEGKKIVFNFVETPELREEVQAFWNGSATTEPKRYFNNIKTIKTRIFQQKELYNA